MSKYFNNIAQLYANILFNYSIENKVIDNIMNDGQKIKAITKHENGLIKQLSAPIYSDKKQQLFLDEFSKVVDLSVTMKNLLNILAKNKKLNLLLQIIDYFELLFMKHQGNKLIEVTVAQLLNELQQNAIKEQLTKLFESKVLVTFAVDARILGGIIIKENNKMIDVSLANKFTHLVEAIKNNILQLELNK